MAETLVQIRDDYGKLRTIGEITSRIFVTKRAKSKHFFRKANAWALDCKVLDMFMKNGNVDYIVIFEQEENINYVVTPFDFKLKSFVNQFKGHRAQYFLPMQEWKQIKGGTVDEVIRQFNETSHV